MIWILIAVCVALYWVGGQSWADTWFRDGGCPLCILGIMSILFGWHLVYLAALPIMATGFTIGDHEAWRWTPHALVIGLAMLVVSVWAGLVVTVISVGLTYLVSRFLAKGGVDVFLRGLLYASLPLMVKLLLR